MKFKIMFLVLTVCFSFTILSCSSNNIGGNEQNVSPTDDGANADAAKTPGEPEDVEILPDLPEENFGGYEFTFLVVKEIAIYEKV
jgi:hypothetical protein